MVLSPARTNLTWLSKDKNKAMAYQKIGKGSES